MCDLGPFTSFLGGPVHYRTFIQIPALSGINSASACESVTTAYFKTKYGRQTSDFVRPVSTSAASKDVPMANARKILIVDDDTDLRDTLVEQLSLHEEFEASAVDTGAKGASAAKANSPDLVLMDVGLPDTDGREVVRSLRKGGFKAPIIMLTGHDTDSDTILGLESGANDYVAKPFRFAVLLARIRAQLRQHEASEDAVFSVGPYSFRPGSKMLTGANARKVRLTEKETAILRFLYRAGQLPVSRETLLQEVWGYNSGVTTHTLETHIYRLRQKIEKDAANPEILVTEAGGYKLVP
jgi:DNA-binding response OmpR family regulator